LVLLQHQNAAHIAIARPAAPIKDDEIVNATPSLVEPGFEPFLELGTPETLVVGIGMVVVIPEEAATTAVLPN